jgi:hypothetical protein
MLSETDFINKDRRETMATISRLYDKSSDAHAVVEELHRKGIADSDISLMSGGHGTHTEDELSNTATGATVGTAVGGAAGLLASLGMLAIPGVGPVVAAGWLLATLTAAAAGAAGGGLIGALTEGGTSQDDAELYAEGLRRGGSLVTVKVSDERESLVTSVMDSRTPVDNHTRRSEYQQGGWTGFDPNATTPDMPSRNNPIERPDDIRR